MRFDRFLGMAALACFGGALCVAACGTDAFTGGEDGGGGDSSTSSDASSDVIVSGDSGSDSAPGCTDRWCNCVAPSAPFCDDFDLSGETLGQSWNNDAGFRDDDGAVIDLSTDAASSAPKSLFVSVPTNGLAKIEGAISVNVGPLTQPLEVAFDMMIPSTLGNCASGSPELARIGSDYSYIASPLISVAFGQQNGAPVLYVYSPSPTTLPIDASIPSGQWMRVRMTALVFPTPDASTDSLQVSVSFDDGGVSDDVDASPVAAATLLAPTISSPVAWTSVGMLDYAVGSTSACQVFIDNVAIYQP